MARRDSESLVAAEERLSPEARVERAKRGLFESISELIHATIESETSGSEWVDQDTSPLGSRRHRALVRAGKLKASRVGKRVLVRRKDIEDFLAKHEVIKVNEDADEAKEVARVLAKMERKYA